ncbi:aryl-sulfate sulfotransferase [Marinococcus luteus]|uniref:aryl-sulfate sulfotransferase n=1 Tax=Marinococcus luteus TaxID=1122204 RepID=UPI002ACC4213|nr:aryl-sulfate sulfotransferase [Marinococcus luteus]MDZ5783541.1 aryl-sulfate sulfotransferase [Marinococcus luteus]
MKALTLLILVFSVGWIIIAENTNQTVSFSMFQSASTTSNETDLIEEQKEMEKQWQQEYMAGNHTFNNPMVIQDPYGEAPLTALTKFHTEAPSRITVTVASRGETQDISHTYPAFNREHEVPVLGLYPNNTNEVTIEAEDRQGNIQEKTVSIETNDTPAFAHNREVLESSTAEMEPGLTFLTPGKSKAYGADEEGDIRWYSSRTGGFVFKRLSNGNLLLGASDSEDNRNDYLFETDMLGKVQNQYKINLPNYEGTNVIHHDAIELPNNNLLVTVHDNSNSYVEDTMVEIDRDTGETVETLDLKDIFPSEVHEEYSGPNESEGDWMHQNAIWYDEENKSILISGRHQDAVMSLTYPDMEINWILGAPEGWSANMDEKVLKPENGNLKYPGAQHAPMILPDQDNNPDTKDVLLFDNNRVITRGDESISKDFSQGIQYRINEEEGTVETVWNYGKERGKDFFSNVVGDADYLYETENRLLTSGYQETEDGYQATVVETAGTTDEVVYELELSGIEEGDGRVVYRAERMPLYPEAWNYSSSSPAGTSSE